MSFSKAASSAGPTNTFSSTRKGAVFWTIFFSLCVSLFLSALDQFAISNALPTIVHTLSSPTSSAAAPPSFAWVGSAYTLAATAFMPLSGGVAQTFGRRPALLACIALFALGSGVCGGARTMGMLIAGRTVQGLGGGGIQSVSAIVLADLVPLRERGTYAGILGMYGLPSPLRSGSY